jgi:hypothetical protein
MEHCEALGRPIRKGDPAQLRVSDTVRIRAALHRGDFADALARAASLHAMYQAIIGTFLEWCAALPAALAQAGYSERVAPITREACRRWQAGISRDNDVHTPGAIEVMQRLLAPDALLPHGIVEYRAQQSAGVPDRAAQLLTEPARLYAEFAVAATREDKSKALAAYSAYASESRSRHDLAGEFVSSFGAALQDELPQRMVAAVLQEGLESCALLKGMWDQFVSLPPDLLAAVLAEHLRGHFSGPGREGAVDVIEETDRYRLVFEPCGTGGAMRQRKVAGLTIFRDASAETWQRTNEVPSYCAHCALNEITSIRRLGYPVWVTEFDPYPDKPCGWTVYKDPTLIPERYFTRLGRSKNK